MHHNAAKIQEHLQFAANLARSDKSAVLEYFIRMAIMENESSSTTALPTRALQITRKNSA